MGPILVSFFKYLSTANLKKTVIVSVLYEYWLILTLLFYFAIMKLSTTFSGQRYKSSTKCAFKTFL